MSPQTIAEMEKFVTSLLEEPEVDVVGGSRGTAGVIIHRLFTAAQRVSISRDATYQFTKKGERGRKFQDLLLCLYRGKSEKRKLSLIRGKVLSLCAVYHSGIADPRSFP